MKRRLLALAVVLLATGCDVGSCSVTSTPAGRPPCLRGHDQLVKEGDGIQSTPVFVCDTYGPDPTAPR